MRLATLALVLWAVLSALLGGLLLVRHLVALPTPPPTDVTLRDAIRTALPTAEWRAVHFMYRACKCSRRTIDHLLATPRPAATRELVVVVDDDGAAGPEDARLAAGGFGVEVIRPDELHTRFHLEASPVLVIMTPDDRIVYVGGYNRHKQSAAYEDLAILAEVRADRSASSLPVYGCATSERLARALDPLQLARMP